LNEASEPVERAKKDKDNRYNITYNLSAAFFIWLFGVLVFIPIAETINSQTKFLVNLIIFIPFTILLLKAIPGVKRLSEIFAVVLARKFKFTSYVKEDEQIIVFKKLLHIVFIIITYLFYFPFLNNFHPAINGIVLIVALLWSFLLLFGILQIILKSKTE